MSKKGNGWVRPHNSRKFHYFVDSHSLCGRYGFMFEIGDEDHGSYDKDDCAKCVREIKKMKEKGLI